MPAPAAALAPAVWRWLGRVPFAETALLQERLRRDVVAGVGPETLLLLEHAPVITLGRAAHDENVLASEEELARRGVAVHRASRGGDVTYHGPGQLVGYPIVRLRRGVRAHVEGMAAALIEVLAAWGVDARYRSEAPGLWTKDQGPSDLGTGARPEPSLERKICAFGINVHHRVAMHGFALNLDPALDAFRMIVPCGLAGVAVTSLREASGRAAPSPEALAPAVAEALGRHLGLAFEADQIATEGGVVTMDLA
ncbi:MAG TPA: lipoyl(octanoyl) transferase LipB [Polyangia bacterium]